MPAVIEGVMNEQDIGLVKVRIIVECANGPTTWIADAVLEQRGVLVVPDIGEIADELLVANAGGVVVSYFEGVQVNQSYCWTAAEVEQRLAERMSIAWERVSAHAAQHQLSLRVAATSLAIQKMAEAHQARGLYPCADQ